MSSIPKKISCLLAYMLLQFFEPILKKINDMVNLDIYKTHVNVSIIISLFINVVYHLTKS